MEWVLSRARCCLPGIFLFACGLAPPLSAEEPPFEQLTGIHLDQGNRKGTAAQRAAVPSLFCAIFLDGDSFERRR